MQFYRVDNDPDLEHRWYLEEPRFKEVDDFDFWPLIAGVKVEAVGGLRVPIQEDGPVLPFTFAAFDIPVVRNDIIGRMSSVDPQGVDSLPCLIPGSSGDYSILIVPRLVECVDEQRSHCTRWTAADGRPDKVGQYRMIVDLRIRGSAVPAGIDIFRVSGWNVALIVSERMRSAIEAVDATGLKFYPV